MYAIRSYYAFFSFKAYVILPAFMLILAFAARMRPKEALLATIRIGAGFAGVFVVFGFFVAQIVITSYSIHYTKLYD